MFELPMHEHTLNRIREAVLSGRYRFSDHALDELDNDHLTFVDAESALLNGTIVRVQPAEPDTSERYTVDGLAADLSTRLAIVCRFDERENLLIITAYEIK